MPPSGSQGQPSRSWSSSQSSQHRDSLPRCARGSSTRHGGSMVDHVAWPALGNGTREPQHHQHRGKPLFQFHYEPFKLAPLGMPAPHYNTCNDLEPLWQGVPNRFSPSCCRETSRCTNVCSMAALSPGPTLPSPPAPATLWTLSPPLQQPHTAPFSCGLQPLLPVKGVKPCASHKAQESGLHDLQPQQNHEADAASTTLLTLLWECHTCVTWTHKLSMVLGLDVTLGHFTAASSLSSPT